MPTDPSSCPDEIGPAPYTFEMGLTMAGAISAGAYIAGVVDFLMEALEAWRQQKLLWLVDPKEQDPRKFKYNPEAGEHALLHETQIKVLTGASAGGLTAAIIAAGMLKSFAPVRAIAPGDDRFTGNIFYDSWVREPEMKLLLQLQDLQSGKVRSLLECSWITDLLTKYMQPSTGDGSRKTYLRDPMHLFLSVANMRGVPYTIPFKMSTAKKGDPADGHQMMRHEDYYQFALGDNPACIDDSLGERAYEIHPNDAQKGYWQLLRIVAQASSAIPMVLLNQVVTRDRRDYDDRRWDKIFSSEVLDPAGAVAKAMPEEMAQAKGKEVKQYLATEDSLEPDWRNWGPGSMVSYSTMLMDGGTFNNEPFELARRCLAGKAMFNPRDANEVNRAVVMVDPFPVLDRDSAADISGYAGKEIHWQLPKMIGAMKEQARFKPHELEMAQADDCYSRFLIAPQRDGAGLDQSPIACGTLGGFGGFLSLKFRQHDFMLGRRNCQRFLTHHYVVPLEDAKNNHVFDRNTPEQLKKFAEQHKNDFGTDEEVIPIIPLVGDTRQEAGMEDYPWASLKYDRGELDGLKKLGRERLKRIAEIYIDKLDICGIWKSLLKTASNQFVYDMLLKKVDKTVQDDLSKNGL